MDMDTSLGTVRKKRNQQESRSWTDDSIRGMRNRRSPWLLIHARKRQ
ncbi:hypothetical protein RBSH_02276 [Rhodopirellula baltica SH28]|uniref:Uncharacterized protein n=1 Tax=Rhodopirellula baltica SH28 TaxID=993517 RepID=K5CEX7_RHOBT|nr:hypothetical protein RBSH_02276 [Rhodopirellula baltica SH28]